MSCAASGVATPKKSYLIEEQKKFRRGQGEGSKRLRGGEILIIQNVGTKDTRRCWKRARVAQGKPWSILRWNNLNSWWLLSPSTRARDGV